MVARNLWAQSKRVGVTQAELAAAMGLTLSAMSRSLKGHVPLTAAEIAVASRWLGVPIDRFYEPIPEQPELVA